MKNWNKFIALALAMLIPAGAYAIQIENGHGNGWKLKIDEEGKASVLAVVEEEFEFISEQDGNAYSWSNATYDYAAGDSILCVRSDSDLELYITDVTMTADVDTRWTIHVPDEYTSAGTVVTGFNHNRKSGNVAPTTAKADETGNTFAQASVVDQGVILASTTFVANLHSGLILGRTDSICIDYNDAGTSAYVTIEGFFKESLGN